MRLSFEEIVRAVDGSAVSALASNAPSTVSAASSRWAVSAVAAVSAVWGWVSVSSAQTGTHSEAAMAAATASDRAFFP